MKTTLKIEISTAADNNIKSIFNSAPVLTIDSLVARYKRYLPHHKVGRGGSHVWISNEKNERLAVIYFN